MIPQWYLIKQPSKLIKTLHATEQKAYLRPLVLREEPCRIFLPYERSQNTAPRKGDAAQAREELCAVCCRSASRGKKGKICMHNFMGDFIHSKSSGSVPSGINKGASLHVATLYYASCLAIPQTRRTITHLCSHCLISISSFLPNSNFSPRLVVRDMSMSRITRSVCESRSCQQSVSSKSQRLCGNIRSRTSPSASNCVDINVPRHGDQIGV